MRDPINVVIMSPTEELRKLNDEVSSCLKKHNTFDIDVRNPRLSEFIKLVKERNLVWNDPELKRGNKTTIVVGVQGSDFEKHERDR